MMKEKIKKFLIALPFVVVVLILIVIGDHYFTTPSVTYHPIRLSITKELGTIVVAKATIAHEDNYIFYWYTRGPFGLLDSESTNNMDNPLKNNEESQLVEGKKVLNIKVLNKEPEWSLNIHK